MGSIREFAEEDVTSSPPSLSEALLFTTVCIVGLPVEVHVKDGSVYSGIFHTASVVDKGYGVALKKARMIRKGTHYANVPNEDLIETLVVLPEDLVQVVAKGIMLPSSAAPGGTSCDNEEAVSRPIDYPQASKNGAVVNEVMKQERQVGVGRHQEEENGHCHYSKSVKEAPEFDGSSPSLNGHCTELDVHKEHNAAIASNQLANETPAANCAYADVTLVNQFHDSDIPKEFMHTEPVTSGISYFVRPESEYDAAHGGLAVTAEMAPQNPLTNRTAKESKLNPGAKVFSPSFPNFISTPLLVPSAPSMAYLPMNIPSVQVAAPQPEVGVRPVAPRSSWPIKIFPYVNFTPPNTDSALQYTQPTMFGRPGQAVYVHSIPHDMAQGPIALSQAPPPFLTSHPIYVAKHEGVLTRQALPVSVAPPVMNHVPQQFGMPSHIQLT